MISVVIPLYNKKERIADTLRCVLAQSYRDFEVVVVDDGSTDDGASVVAGFSDPRIRLVTQVNSGVSSARNRGISEASGEFVALLDADDRWSSEHLATLFGLAQNYPMCDVFATGYQYQNEHGETKKSWINKLCFSGEQGELSNYFEVATCSDPPVNSTVVMARKSAFMAVGGFPEQATSGEDLLTWARLAARFRIALSRKVTATYYTPTTGPTGKVPADLRTTHDYVGNELIALAEAVPQKRREIYRYVNFWYKMRSVINLHFPFRRAAMACAIKAIRYYPAALKPYALLVIACLPESLIRKFLK